MFPYLPRPATARSRCRAAAGQALHALAAQVSVVSDAFRFIDATPVPCGTSRLTLSLRLAVCAISATAPATPAVLGSEAVSGHHPHGMPDVFGRSHSATRGRPRTTRHARDHHLLPPCGAHRTRFSTRSPPRVDVRFSPPPPLTTSRPHSSLPPPPTPPPLSLPPPPPSTPQSRCGPYSFTGLLLPDWQRSAASVGSGVVVGVVGSCPPTTLSVSELGRRGPPLETSRTTTRGMLLAGTPRGQRDRSSCGQLGLSLVCCGRFLGGHAG